MGAVEANRHLYLANDLTYKTDIALGAPHWRRTKPFLDHRLLR